MKILLYLIVLMSLSFSIHAADEQDELKALNGIRCDILDRYEGVEGDSYIPQCLGRNPPGAKYRYVVKQCTEYKDGVAIRTWQETQKTFIKCIGW